MRRQQTMRLLEAGRSVVFFDNPYDDDPAGMTWAMGREAWEKLGQPEKVVVTVKAA